MKHGRIISGTLGLGIFSSLGLCMGLVGGCSDEPTEVVAGFTTQIQVPKIMKAVAVVVDLGGTIKHCRFYPVVDGEVLVPATLGIQREEVGDDLASSPVTISLLGFESDVTQFGDTCAILPNQIPKPGDDTVRILRRHRTSYIADRILYLPMPLKESCAGVVCDDEEETCIGGKCESIDVDPESLVDYRDSLVFGNTNTCFSLDKCLPSKLTFPATLLDAKDCTFEISLPDEAPAPEKGNLNVQVIYSSFTSEVLDLDDKEGFIVPDPDQPLRFQLAPNLCESNYQTGRILSVVASPACPSKRALQPICDGDLKKLLDGEDDALGGEGANERCTDPNGLIATESALYVLLDRSASMSKFFGTEGLKFALETPLANPIAERTRIAFDFLPEEANSCTSEPRVATPEIDFDEVANVRERIGALLGDPNNVLGTDDNLFLDAALRAEGAYAALAAVENTPGNLGFNRKALMIIGNRDFRAQCGGAGVGEPVDLAADALASGLHTYVTVLQSPSGGEPVQEGRDIALAGGTEAFDATVDEEEGAIAVQSIVNDLGSCVYDQPGTTGLLDTGAILSYLNPIDLSRVDIPNNEDCSETSGSEISGWNNVNDKVRICGTACDDLRDVLTDVAFVAAAFEAPAPKIPILVSGACDAGFGATVADGNTSEQ